MKKDVIDINEVKLIKHIESWRPNDLEIRKQLDYTYSFDGITAFLYVIRPYWNKPDQLQKIEFAKIRYFKSKKQWSLYWKRANGNWESYNPFPSSIELNDILETIKEDKHGCFFG